MSIKPELQALSDEVWRGEPLPDGRYQQICEQMHALLTKGQLESLAQLVKYGPVWDGDIVSKATRGELFDLYLASRAVYRGKEGYTVANYFGYKVLDPKWEHAWKHEQTLLSTPLDDLSQTELQARYEMEERHAEEVMQRAAKTLRALRERIDRARVWETP